MSTLDLQVCVRNVGYLDSSIFKASCKDVGAKAVELDFSHGLRAWLEGVQTVASCVLQARWFERAARLLTPPQRGHTYPILDCAILRATEEGVGLLWVPADTVGGSSVLL